MQARASKYDRTENSPTNKAAHRSTMWHCGHVTCCNLHSKIKIIIERRNTLTTASRPQLRGRLMLSMVFGFVLLYCITKYGRQILIIMVYIDFGPAQVEHLDYGIKALVTGQVDVVYGVCICIAVLCNEIWTSDIIMVYVDFGPAQVEHLDYGVKALVTGQVDMVDDVCICIAVLRSEMWTSDINYHVTH